MTKNPSRLIQLRGGMGLEVECAFFSSEGGNGMIVVHSQGINAHYHVLYQGKEIEFDVLGR